MDCPHPDYLGTGHHSGFHDPYADAVLRRTFSFGSCGSRFFPRHHRIPDALVPAGGSCQGRRIIYDRDSCRKRPGLAAGRLAAGCALAWYSRMAMVVHRGRDSGRITWHSYAALLDRLAASSRVAARGRTGMDHGRTPTREGSKSCRRRVDGKSGARQPQSDSAGLGLLFRTRGTLRIQFLVPDDPQARDGTSKSDGDIDCGIALSIGHRCDALERLGLRPHRGTPLAHGPDPVLLRRVYGSRGGFTGQPLARSRLADSFRRVHDSLHAQLLATAHGYAE